MRVFALLFLLIAVVGLPAGLLASPRDEAQGCGEQIYRDIDLIVCRFDPSQSDIRLFLKDAGDENYGHFNKVNEALAAAGARLAFAMNAGMYHENRAPVGLYVENAMMLKPLNTNEGPGNFHMLPNGVFWIWVEDGFSGAHVASTEAYRSSAAHEIVRYATQSGPMLVIEGKIHPRFLSESDSLKRRNGVGVTEDGEVIFVLADTPVRFYDFAMFFRDELKTPNALYLDGTISRVFVPELQRNDPGAAMGPIIGVVVKE